MSTDTATTPTSTKTQPSPCDDCPTRSPELDTRLGYCEGCPRKLRLCPSCENYRPQTGWGWGFHHPGETGTAWVCANCRFPLLPRSQPTIAERAAHLEREVTPR